MVTQQHQTHQGNFMKSGASESSYFFLEEYYKFPENIIVSHLPQELQQSNKPIKILWSQHSYDQPVYLNFDFSICDLIVSPSNWCREQFIKYHHIPEDKIVTIPTGVSKKFTYSSKKSKTFIYTSIPYKGLEVLAQIIPHIPEATFKIFSAMNLYDIEEDPYIELYEYLKSLPNVIYSPAVDQAELIEHLQDAAFFIHPNIWEETFCVSLAEAMSCGCFPILTDIGALPEVSNEIANIVPMEGTRTSKGYQVTDNFLNNFINACKSALHFFDNDRDYYNKISQSVSNYATETYDWKKIAETWKTTIQSLGETMTEPKFNQLKVITPEEAAKNEDYLKVALEEVLRWEEEDKELAQGRTNFQIEKFFLLEQYTVPSAFHAALKNRRILAEGYMQKIIEIKERVREFEYKWEGKDKTKPVEWATRGPNSGTKLCWYDIEQIEMTHYLKSTELEIRDRIQQMDMFDKILNKLVEMNGGPVTREQFEEDDNVYWERRFAEQAMDEMISSRTGISIGNIHSMRRGTAPTLVSDDVNRIKNGYGSLADAVNNPDAFLNGLQEKVLHGISEVTGTSLDQLVPGAPNQQLLESRE
jgi:glycosyltransferase involved in cell wall biosynthesis